MISTVNLQDAITRGRSYDRGRASPVGLLVHMICCSGW